MKLVKLMLTLAIIVLVNSSIGFALDRRGVEQPNQNAIQQQQLIEKQKVIQNNFDETKQKEATPPPAAEDLKKPVVFESTTLND